VKVRPCKEGTHVEDEKAATNLVFCGTPYCSADCFRCARCGWWVTECRCGSCTGANRISPRQEAAIERRRERRRRVLFELREMPMVMS